MTVILLAFTFRFLCISFYQKKKRRSLYAYPEMLNNYIQRNIDLSLNHFFLLISNINMTSIT